MMKKLFLIFLVIFVAPLFCLGGIQDAHKQVIARINNCGTQTFVGDPGDTETFEYQENDFCTTEFSYADPDGILSTYDNTQVKNGTYALSIAFDGTANYHDNYFEANLGGTDAAFTVSFWVRVYAITGVQDQNLMGAFTDPNHAGDRAFKLKFSGDGAGGITFTIDGSADDTSIALVAPAWYRVEVEFQKAVEKTVEIYNSADALQDTLVWTGENIEPQYLHFGIVISDTEADETTYYDDIRYKSSGGGF